MKGSMIVANENYYGVNVEKLAASLEGEVEFVGFTSLDIQGAGWRPVVLFHAKNPNRAKGHKDYVFLFGVISADDFIATGNKDDIKTKFYISGRNENEIQEERYQHGVYCTECKTVLHSVHRHDYKLCGCSNETMVDGGQDYLRFGGLDLNKVKPVTIDILTGKAKIKRVTRHAKKS